MTIPRFGSNPTQLQMQMHHMRPMSSGLQLQPSPFDASAGDTYAKDSGVPQLVAAPSRRTFLETAGIATLLLAGCGKDKGQKSDIATKPGKDTKTLRQDQATPVTLPPDGIGDVDGFETLASSDGGRGVFSKSSSFPLWGKAGIIGGGVVGAALLLWGATVLFVRRSNKAGQARREKIDDNLMAANEYHDLGPKGIQVRYKQTDGALATDIIDKSDNMVFVRLLEKNRPLFPRNPLKWRKWRSGELKRCTFRIDDYLDEMGVTDDSERDDIRSFVNTAIGQGWIREVKKQDPKTGMIEGKAHEFLLTPYKKKKQKKVAAPALQPQVKIDQHALVKVDGEGYYIYAKGQLRRLYPEVWQGKVIERISAPDIKNGPTRKHLYTEVAKPVDKSVTQDMVNQLLRNIGSTGILAPNSEIYDEFLIVAPLAPKVQAEAELYDNRGTILFEVSNAQPSGDDGQPPQQNTMASVIVEDPSADGPKKQPPYYVVGEGGEISQIVMADGTINVPEAWQKALSFCADTGGCSTRVLVKAYDAFKSEEMLDFQDYVESSETLQFIEFSGKLGNDTLIKITIPSEADALALLDPDEKATKAGVEPVSLEALADGYTQDQDQKQRAAEAAAQREIAEAAPAPSMSPPPRSASSGPAKKRPLTREESARTEIAAPLNKPPSPTPEAAPPADAALGNELEFSFPGDSETRASKETISGIFAAILRRAMDTPLSKADIQGIVDAGLAANITEVSDAAGKLAHKNSGFLEKTDEGFIVPEDWRKYFPEMKNAAPETVAEPDVEEVDPADIMFEGDAEAAPDIAVKPETQELDIVDITFVSDAEAAQAQLEAAQAALTEAKTESSQAIASLEAATQALEVAKAAAAEAKDEARAKSAAVFEAELEGEEAEEQAEQAATEAKDIYLQKRFALAEAQEAVVTGRAVLEEVNERWIEAQAAEKTALSALEEAQAEEAAAKAEEKTAPPAEPDVTDPVQAAQARLLERMAAKRQAASELNKALKHGEAAAKGEKAAEKAVGAAEAKARTKSNAVFDAKGEEARAQAQSDAAEAMAIFAQKEAVLKEAEEAMGPAGERLKKARADLETAKEKVKEADQDMLIATAAAPAEDADPDTLVRSDSKPTLHAVPKARAKSIDDAALTLRIKSKEVTDEVRRAEAKTQAANSAFDDIMNDGAITVPAVIGRALKKRLKAEGKEFDSRTKGGQMTLTIKASEEEVQRAYDKIMDDDDGTITTSAVLGRALQKLLKDEGEEFDSSTSGGQMTITLKD